jgi:hypothetical protein
MLTQRRPALATPTRAAGVAALLGLLATVGLIISQLHGGPLGYVSEAGVPGLRFADLYRASVLAIAVMAALLGYALWPAAGDRPGPPGWAAAALLATAAPMVAISAAVTCSEGCPLPPYEPTTTTDLVHAVASIIGVGCCALAMLVLAWRSEEPLRRVSRWAVALAWPVLVTTAVGILVVGRGAFTGLLERIGLAACIGWLVVVAGIRWQAGTGGGVPDRR